MRIFGITNSDDTGIPDWGTCRPGCQRACSSASATCVLMLEKLAVPLLSELNELIDADRDLRVMVGFQHVYSALTAEALASIRRARWDE
jgi:hypothetical protein